MEKSNNRETQEHSVLRRFIGSSEFGVLIALVVLCVLMTFLNEHFLTPANIVNILQQISQIAILSVGMALIIITGGIDLSVGYAVGLTGCCCCYMYQLGYSWPVVMILTLLLGVFIGLVNGCLITGLNIAPFIVTLGTSNIMRGLTLFLTGGMPISVKGPLTWLGRTKLFDVINVSILLMLVVAVLGTVFSNRTVTGRNIYAVGNNERAAQLSGIHVKRIKILVYVLQGFLAGLCGIVASGKLMSADASLGSGYEMNVIAAAVIGGVAMTGGEGKVWGAVIGACIIGVLNNAFILLGLSSYWQTASVGIVIILAVSIAPVKEVLRERKFSRSNHIKF